MSLIPDISIWTLCILEWDSVVFKSHMNVKQLITRGTFTICLCPLQASFRRYQLPLLYKKGSYLIMILGGLSLNNRLIAAQMTKKTKKVKTTYLNLGIAL